MKYPKKAGSFSLGPWRRGLDNVHDPHDVPEDAFSASKNLVVDDDGSVDTRPGLVSRVAGTNIRGLFQVSEDEGLFFDGGALKRLNARTWEAETLASGFAFSGLPQFAAVGPRIYFTTGAECGRVDLPEWDVLAGFGTPNPTLEVTLSALSYGNFPAGRYFVALTFVDAKGEESGAPELHLVELASEGGIGIALSGTVPPLAEALRVYCTEPNGIRDELFRIAEVDADDTSVILTLREFGSPLTTLFLDEIPAPELLTLFNGYLYFSVGNRVWHSEGLRYGLYHEDHNEVGAYPQGVSVLERGRDGLFVVADRTYAYVGASPKDFRLRDDVFNFPAAKYSGRQIDGTLFALEGIGKETLPYWFSARGPVLGLPGGEVLPATKGRAEPDRFDVGVSGTVEIDGKEAIMTALDERRGPKDAVAFSDSFSVRVIKRGLSDE